MPTQLCNQIIMGIYGMIVLNFFFNFLVNVFISEKGSYKIARYSTLSSININLGSSYSVSPGFTL